MELLAEIRELIANLASLTPDQLTDLRAKIASCFDEIDKGESTPETVEAMNELVGYGTQVMEAQAAAEQAAADAEAQRVAAREAIAKIRNSDKAEGEGEGDEPAADAAAEEDADADAEGKVPAAVAASSKPGTSISKMARSAGKPSASPDREPVGGGRTALVATGSLDGVSSGTPISDRDQFAELLSGTLDHLDPRDKARGTVIVARAEWGDKYHPDRVLGKDVAINTKRLAMADREEALVATGGICSPVNVDWSLEAWATAERPLRDALPAFQATRGGITFRTPPDYSALSSSTAVWTEATDANPAGATKPVQTIACPSVVTAYVDAVPTRLGFGNMEGMFDPETVAVNTELSLAYAAQVADLNLWNRIQAQATTGITTGQVFGAARTFIATLDRALAVYRNTHRLSDQQRYTIIAPRWLKDMIRIDRALEIAHDGQSIDPFDITDEWIDGLLASRNVKAIWMLDFPGAKTGGGAYATQNFTAFTTNTATPVFPSVFVWDLFVEGGVQLLDGGRLDLGVVRDSTLDATNDYETFVEVFEGIAVRTFTGGVLQFITTVCANGASATTSALGSCL